MALNSKQQMKPYHKNPRRINKKQFEQLKENLLYLGDLSGIVHDLNSNEIIGGNQRSSVFDVSKCDVEIVHQYDYPDEQGTIAHGFIIWKDKRYTYRQVRWTPKQCEQANITANRLGGEWDFDELANWDMSDLLTWGFEESDFPFDVAPATNEDADAEPQIDKAEELRQKWDVQSGQMWQLGEHRIVCGDCTDRAVVERVMGGDKAVLCHADPPYGMGKEKDGIVNDNLYREKLDEFQMKWWEVCRPSLEDNASTYIWGNAEDLWRLWHRHLEISERLTFRNEIVWDKGSGQGMLSDAHRMFPTASERCIFFMLGEQGFNNNADNYWDGWEPIRGYLKAQRDLMGWDNARCKTLAGHSPQSGCHWFDASQWSFVTEDVYNTWQLAANGKAFQRDYDELKRDYDELKRDYDELKRDFYATRAYFDNTHDGMTDVWSFPRVTGDDRHEHATPKPVAMMERAIKSSSPVAAIVYEPFSGSGTTLIACENLSRKARAVEISPAYVAVAIQRWVDVTGKEPILL